MMTPSTASLARLFLRPAFLRPALVGALACAALGAHAGDTIQRCSDASGVTYTDRGCGAGMTVVALNTASASFVSIASGDESEAPVRLGMDPRAVFEALGRPVETIATLRGRQLVEYWRYRGAPGGVTRVAFQEGRVTGVQAK